MPAGRHHVLSRGYPGWKAGDYGHSLTPDRSRASSVILVAATRSRPSADVDNSGGAPVNRAGSGEATVVIDERALDDLLDGIDVQPREEGAQAH